VHLSCRRYFSAKTRDMDTTLRFTIHSDDLDFQSIEDFVIANPSDLKPEVVHTKVLKEGRGLNDIYTFVTQHEVLVGVFIGLSTEYLKNFVNWSFSKLSEYFEAEPRAIFTLLDNEKVELTPETPPEKVTEKLVLCLKVGIKSLDLQK
jgi:hypothetical protein